MTGWGPHTGHNCPDGARGSWFIGLVGVHLSVGDRVRRGKDWKWGTQDEKGAGTVVEALDSDGWLAVKWDHGSRNK